MGAAFPQVAAMRKVVVTADGGRQGVTGAGRGPLRRGLEMGGGC